MRGGNGRVATVVVGPDVRNFQNVKLGDEVTTRYEADAARQAPPGGKPGVSAMERTAMVANVF